MRIGTLSLNINAPDFNYGAMLHSWAFQQYLSKIPGVETEIIDYTMPKVEGWNRYNPAKSGINYTGKRYIEGSMDDYLKRAKKFDDFIEKNLTVSKEKYNQRTIFDANLDYDTIICESDVIWAPKRGKFDPVFYLSTPSMQGKRRIAYAPSMADADIGDSKKEELSVLLKNVHFISCRESYMESVLREYTDKDITHVVDPVMLLDAEDYESICAPRLMPEKYMMLYLPVDENETLRNSAIEYAKKNGLKILEISTMLKSDGDRVDLCIPDAGIEEFLSAIKYSEIVFTNSFHAICFSIIYSRQFYAFTRKFNGKVLDICEFFNLDDYYAYDDIFVERKPFDTDAVHARFKELQKEAKDWLKNALESEMISDDKNYNADIIRGYLDKTDPVNSAIGIVTRKSKKLLKKSKRLTKKAVKKVNKKAGGLRREIQRQRFDALANNIRSKTNIDNNSIVVSTITDSFNCNPKYICQEIIRRKLPYNITWLIAEDTNVSVFPEEIRLVNKDTKEAMEAVYSAKLWLDNGICFSNTYERKPGQYHIQTMHGSLGIKRLNNSIGSRSNTQRGRNVIRRESENTDYILTNSQFEDDVFSTVFWKNVPMERIGHARTDILFNENSEIAKDVRQRLLSAYGIPLESKIVLYAPTHRKGLTLKDLSIDYVDLVRELKEKFGGDFVVLIRMHKKTAKILMEGLEWTDELKKVLFDVTDYPDIQELMCVTEIGITDYSSWIYDYVNARRPGFIFSTDLARYNNKTGLYYPLEETPFPVCKSHHDLINKVRGFDMDKYQRRVEEFLSDKKAVDDGKSAARAVDLIESLMK